MVSAACSMLPAFREWMWLLTILSISSCQHSGISEITSCDRLRRQCTYRCNNIINTPACLLMKTSRWAVCPYETNRYARNVNRGTREEFAYQADGMVTCFLGSLKEPVRQVLAVHGCSGIKQSHTRVIEIRPRICMSKT
jgi:hypothetical protein